VKRNRRRLKFPNENCGEQVLPGVLLHVIEAARPIDLPFNLGSFGEWLLHEMPDGSRFVFFDLLDWNLDIRSRC